MITSKKVLTFIGLLIMAIVCSPDIKAQDMEKTVIITKKYAGGITSQDHVVAYALSVTETYNSDLTIADYSFMLSAQNDRYETLQDLFVISFGDAQEIYNFTNWVLSFIDVCKVEDLKVPIDEFNIPLTIEYENWKIMGKRYCISDGKSYHYFKKSEIEKIQKELLKYCANHSIGIDPSVEFEMNPSLGGKN